MASSPTTIRRRPKPPRLHTITAPCGAGLEGLVAREVQDFGGQDIEKRRGAVTWQGTLETAYRACLWSRFASRILLQLTTFSCPDQDALYDAVRAMDWQAHMTEEDSLAVDAVLVKSTLNHSHFAALKVKDGVVDFFRDLTGQRPNIEKYQPDIRLNLFVYEDEAKLSLDLAGSSLHQRGYRVDGGHAPLKESLAAAIVALAGVNSEMDKEQVILDPLCGSGTLLIEAAMIIGDIAPGLDRRYFALLQWQQHDRRLWKRLVAEAMEREEAGRKRPWPKLIGYDANFKVVKAALANIDKADFSSDIHVEKRVLANLTPPSATGLLVTNPPYGERLAEQEEMRYLYRALGRIMGHAFAGWRAAIFSSEANFFDALDQRHQGLTKLFNGPIPCQLRTYEIAQADKKSFPWQLQPLERPTPLSRQLEKNCQELFAWAEEGEVECFRIYDRELDAFDMAVDIMGYWLYIHEYGEPDRGKQQEVIGGLAELFGINRHRIFSKPAGQKKKRQRGKERQQRLYEVGEGGCTFLVSFAGLFGLSLKERKMRLLVQERANKKRVLVLFAGTGTVTCHALRGGAAFTTSVDPSELQLEWARKNIALNGFGRPGNRLIGAEILEWLEGDRDSYELIVIDLPSFNGQKKQKGLLAAAMARLSEDGSLLLSAATGRLQLGQDGEAYAVTDISKDLQPHDFQNKRQLRCLEIKHL
ncbi:MAG: bifunctional 23S rRNA (guanine(2069)-N(7))-methyltransferase RlmK/23S rRNA (guanine(2445)-N(2))-methyltransferase RlmL [Thermodesulfobacteriota bacterium]